MVVRATRDTKIKYHVPHPGSPVEELKVAFCLTGASRSLPTVPVLRGFKKNVLQSRRYVAAAFAALSLSPNVPGVHDSNLTLASKLSNVLYVRRAMQRLQPELKSWVTVNSSEVIAQYGQRSCPAGGGLQPTAHTTPMTTMWLTSLYAMQRCYDLVRGYEVTLIPSPNPSPNPGPNPNPHPNPDPDPSRNPYPNPNPNPNQLGRLDNFAFDYVVRPP